MNEAAFFDFDGTNLIVLADPALNDVVNFELDKQKNLWIDSHFTAFIGMQAQGMYGINNIRVSGDDKKNVKYPFERHYLAQVIRVLFDNPILEIGFQLPQT